MPDKIRQHHYPKKVCIIFIYEKYKLYVANYLFCKTCFCTFLGLRSANDNMEKLMTRLEKLSVAIGQLNPASSSKNSPSHSNGGGGIDFGNGNHSLNR